MAYYRNQQHIVYSTKNRRKTLNKQVRTQLYSVIGQILKDHKCKPILINGVEDHLHILCEIHPTISISNLIKAIKIESSKYLKSKFPTSGFEGWQESYGIFSFDKSRQDGLCKYVLNQEEHHKQLSSSDELKGLLIEHEIEYDPKYFF
jgi:REP element-mobilizing transposase RayT